jgi:uncharacterized phage-associated protein
MDMTNKYDFFNIEKIVQIFYYIQKNSGAVSKLELIKFLFFADRIHIRKHFSFISLDNYVALKYGPVASGSLNVLNKEIDYLSNFSENELSYLDNVQQTGQHEWKIKEMPNDLLSKNETYSIDKSIELFSGKKLIEISHDYPEWKRYKELFEKKLVSWQPVVVDDFFRNPDVNDSPAIQKYFGSVDPLYEDEEYLQEARSFFLQSTKRYAG